MPDRRWMGIGFGALVAMVLFLGGCDFFATSAFTSKPSSPSSVLPLATTGAEMRYRVEESLWGSEKVPLLKLPEREIILTRRGDTSITGTEYALFSIVVKSDKGVILEGKSLWVRSDLQGLNYREVEATGGTRLFALKSGQEDDVDFFHSLPAHLFEGARWVASEGLLNIDREIVGLDTLKFRGGLEETWVVEEKLRHEGSLVGLGSYRFGVSGMVLGELRWPAFPWRSEAGTDLGQVELRRSLRLL